MKNSSTPKKVPSTLSTSPTSPRASSRRPLLIVESPAKAKTISKYLGTAYMVEASVGHIADIPEKKNSVDVDNGFAVEYVLTPKGRETITHLRQQLKKASMLILATDADREGELIAAHLVEFLKPIVPVHSHSLVRLMPHSWKPPRLVAFWIVCMDLKCRRCCGAKFARIFQRGECRVQRCGLWLSAN